MTKTDNQRSSLLRIGISLTAIVLPVLLLTKGIYGSFLFTFSVPVIWLFGVQGRPIRFLQVKRTQLLTGLALGAGTGILLGLSGGYLLSAFGLNHIVNNDPVLTKELGYRLLTLSDSAAGMCIYLLFSVLVIGLGEEFFWRGFVMGEFSRYTGTDGAIFITAALFASVHSYVFVILPVLSGPFLLALIFAAGVCWGYLTKLFGNIWAAALSHGIAAMLLWKYFFFAH